jgi:RNAse (barnase) inhibitor barstar
VTETFEFLDPPDICGLSDNFVIRIPPGIDSKENLFKIIAELAQFPQYFGKNWDALLDCLRDFHWVKLKNITIVHEDVPLMNLSSECQIYLDVLEDTLLAWSHSINDAHEENISKWPIVEHNFRIIFPKNFFDFVNRARNVGER